MTSEHVYIPRQGKAKTTSKTQHLIIINLPKGNISLTLGLNFHLIAVYRQKL